MASMDLEAMPCMASCDLSALPVITEENEPTQAKDKKRQKSSKSTKSSPTDRDSNKHKELPHEHLPQFNENEDHIFNASLSPILSSNLKPNRVFSRTEAHPNAIRNINPEILKNIKNFTLLQASVTDMINHKEGSALSHHFRSLSALDYDNVSESFASDKE